MRRSKSQTTLRMHGNVHLNIFKTHYTDFSIISQRNVRRSTSQTTLNGHDNVHLNLTIGTYDQLYLFFNNKSQRFTRRSTSQTTLRRHGMVQLNQTRVLNTIKIDINNISTFYTSF